MLAEGLFRRRRLPHWDIADATYFVTSCLANSIPARGLSAIRRYRSELDSRTRPAHIDEDSWEEHKHKLVFARFDWYIDHEPAVRWLEEPAVARAVVDSLYHFAGQRYHLLAFVVMPSHIHWLFRPIDSWCDSQASGDVRTPRERVLHSLKSYTAHTCNALLGRTGAFWQDESYEHCVRNEAELLRIVDYIERNPVKAAMVHDPTMWPYSSACDRQRQVGMAAEPLLSEAART